MKTNEKLYRLAHGSYKIYIVRRVEGGYLVVGHASSIPVYYHISIGNIIWDNYIDMYPYIVIREATEEDIGTALMNSL